MQLKVSCTVNPPNVNKSFCCFYATLGLSSFAISDFAIWLVASFVVISTTKNRARVALTSTSTCCPFVSRGELSCRARTLPSRRLSGRTFVSSQTAARDSETDLRTSRLWDVAVRRFVTQASPKCRRAVHGRRRPTARQSQSDPLVTPCPAVLDKPCTIAIAFASTDLIVNPTIISTFAVVASLSSSVLPSLSSFHHHHHHDHSWPEVSPDPSHGQGCGRDRMGGKGERRQQP